MNKAVWVLIVTLVACGVCAGQTPWKGVRPGSGTRQEIERITGQPVRAVSKTLIEYSSGNAGEKIYVQYRRDSEIVERIEASFSEPVDRAVVLRAINLPNTASASQTGASGRREEYFSPQMILLTHAAEEVGKIGRIAYFSKELFESVTAGLDLGTSAVPAPPAPVRNPPATSARQPAAPKPPPTTTASGGRVTTTNQAGIRVTEMPDLPSETVSRPGAKPGGRTIELSEYAGIFDFSGDSAAFKSASVLYSAGKLYLTIPAGKFALVADSGTQSTTRGEMEIKAFQVEGRPGTRLLFFMTPNGVQQVAYSDERSGGEMMMGERRR